MPLSAPKLRDLAAIGFGLMLAVLVIGGGLGFVNARRLAENERLVAHSHEVIGELEGLLSALKDAETGQRGYLLTEDVKYLQPYESALGQVPVRLNRLLGLTSDNPLQQDRLAVLGPKVAVRLNELKQTVALVKQGDRPAAMQIVREDTGKAMMDDLREQVAAIRQTEEDLLRRRSAEAQASYRTTSVAIFLPVLIGVALIGVVFYLTQQNMRRQERAAALLAEQKEQVRKSEERFRSLVSATAQVVWTMNATGQAVEDSPSWRAFTGQTSEQWKHRGWLDAIHPEDREPTAAAWQQAVESPSIFSVEYRLRRHDGEYRWMAVRAVPVRTVSGSVSEWVGMDTDITERKQHEKELAESQRTLFGLVEQCPFGIYIVDADFRIASMNAGSQTGAFINVRPVIGRPFDEAMRILWPEPVAADIIQHFRHTLDTGTPYRSKDFVNPRADIDLTEGYEWELHRIPLPDGRHGVVCYYYDSTKLRQVERALRETQQQLAAELEAMTRLNVVSTRLLAAADLPSALDDLLENAILASGAAFGNIQLYNPQVGGLEIVAQRGFQRAFLDYFRTVRLEEGSACAQAMQSGQRIIIEDVNLDPAYTPHRPVAAAAGYRAVQSTPLKDRRGTVIGMLSTHFPRPHRPSQRDELLLDLYGRVAADLIERIRFEQALKEADRKKDEFLATLAHELRNPLAPLRTGLQVMKLAKNDTRVVEQSRVMMERQLEQMVRLIDDLLDLSRISRGKIVLHKTRTLLATVIRNAVETSRPLIEQGGHDLTLHVPDEPIYVEADETRLSQAVGNLLNNAAKYTERAGRIQLAVERQGSDAVVTVTDNGVGIPAHMLPRVFDMFTQVDQSLEKARGGLGIGLSLVQRLVEMHGGSIEAESGGHGMGSTFTVRLPVVLALASASPSDEADARALPTARRRILIVDDNRDAAISLAMMLNLMGNETQTAHDGLEGVEVAAAFRPDVILLDIGMPKLNGYDACRRIRGEPWGKNVVLVACTGWGQEGDKRKSREAGFNFHLVKPIDGAALENLLAGLQATTG
jgi:PAS domain S-box-containing protein